MFEKFNHYLRFAIVRTRLSLKNAMEFKIDFIGSILAETAFVILTYIIANVFTKAIPNFGLTAIELFIYTQTLDVIFTMQQATGAQIIDSIKSGQMNLDLIRPLNIIYITFWNNVGTKVILIQILKFIVMLFYISLFSNINIIQYFVIVIILAIFSLLLTNGFFYLVRAYDLKKLEAGTFLHRISNETNISNYVITYPIYLLPKFILVYSSFFSLYYVGFVTLNMINNANILTIVILLFTELILAIILIFFANLAWKKMLKYYEGFGG